MSQAEFLNNAVLWALKSKVTKTPFFKKLKNFSYSCLTIEPKVNLIAKKAIREIKRVKNPQKVFLNPKEKKFK
ncbi:hypothetical protein HpBT091_03660 [Helicobacter pylori]